ncbi:PP2C family protein-serine/threonine phosphatase [Pararhizobium sp.]|uniref:PP2C family protein-serine/threonine phosphatase n=1 Tax=Pararhizobium sp. TaxID=1977563 RepID=UPI003D1407C3
MPPAEHATGAADSALELDFLRAELAALRAEHDDLTLLYEALIEHGEAVEDQLTESNLALRTAQRRLEAELEDAARYVTSLLPAPRAADPATDWQFVPSTELGGDSFGYHAIDEDHLAIYLIDVCGHGVGAALLSATVVNVLRNAALTAADFRDPPRVLAALNDAFPMERQNDMFFTIWYGVYDYPNRRLRYSTGGHPPAVHLRTDAGGTVHTRLLATPGGMAIGAIEGVTYRSEDILIEPGDRLLVLSDGTFEVSGDGAQMLGIAELASYAAQECDDPDAILRWVLTFGDGGPLPDDFSLLRLQF